MEAARLYLISWPAEGAVEVSNEEVPIAAALAAFLAFEVVD